MKLVSEARAELEFSLLFILFFLFFFLHLMQFGSLQSHKYILTLCFKLIYFSDTRLMFYEEACPIPVISSYLQIPHVQKAIHSVVFSPVRTLPSASFPRDRPPEHGQHIPTTLTISSSMGHADWKIHN